MFSDPQQVITLVLAFSTFVLVMSLWIGGVVVWAARQAQKTGQVRRRLGIEDDRAAAQSRKRTLHLWHEGEEMSVTVPTIASSRTVLSRFENAFHAAGWPMSGGQALVLLMGVTGLTFLFIFVVTGNALLGVGVAAAVLVILRIYMAGRISKREALFETQLMDAMELAARSLRAGHPLLGAFHLISEEMAPPVNSVFERICQQHGMGGDLEAVLRDAAMQSTSDDMKLFATSVAIQMRSGGNLADLMERLAELIRIRQRIHRRLRVLTAQTQMSKRVLIGLPFVIFILLNVIAADYMSAFYDTHPGRVMLGVSAGLLALGTLVMNRMAAMKY